jgi:DNA replicative helicase MCM subunit Mcm2 (Cdc46/Mcm family)
VNERLKFVHRKKLCFSPTTRKMRDQQDGDEHGDSPTQNDEEDEEADEQDNGWSASKLIQASYNDLGTPKQVQGRFLVHLERHCSAGIRSLLQDANNTSRDYSMQVDVFDLLQADPVLGYLVLKYPTTLLPVLELAMVQAQQKELLRRMATTEPESPHEEEETTTPTAANITTDTSTKNWTIKGLTSSATTRVHARLVHLPPTCCKPSLGASISAQDVGKIWQVTGTVVRTGPVQMYESARTYKCCGCNSASAGGHRRGGGGGNKNAAGGEGPSSKTPHCGKTFLVQADLEQRYNTLTEPDLCPGTLPDGERCPGNKFQIVAGGAVHTDYQEIKISADNNQMPGSLLIKLQHDLVDQCQPGDEVAVVGILLAQWHQSYLLDDMDCNVSMAMTAHSVRVIAENGDSWKKQHQHVGEVEKYKHEFNEYWQEPDNMEHPIAARDFITKAICPKLYGMQVVKLALLLTLIGEFIK